MLLCFHQQRGRVAGQIQVHERASFWRKAFCDKRQSCQSNDACRSHLQSLKSARMSQFTGMGRGRSSTATLRLHCGPQRPGAPRIPKPADPEGAKRIKQSNVASATLLAQQPALETQDDAFAALVALSDKQSFNRRQKVSQYQWTAN